MPGKFSKHENVRFHFFTSDETYYADGTVIVRPGEMVLSIESGPYTIVGKACEYYFVGEDGGADRQGATSAKWCDRESDGPGATTARWCNLEGTFVGVWHEEDQGEFVFSFRLGSPSLTGDMDD